MSGTELRVRYVDGVPKSVKHGAGYFGKAVSMAHIKNRTAIVSYDNAGATDFEAELLKLSFVDEVKNYD